MTIFALVVAVAVAIWVVRRRARAGVLAGRVADKPTYSIEPPTRRHGRLKDGRL